MRKIICRTTLIGVGILVNFLMAQPEPTINHEIDRLSTHLDLSEEQQVEILLILENHQQEMNRIRELNREDVQAQKNAAREQQELLDKQIKHVLTPEQFHRYQAFHSDHRFSKRTRELQRILQLSETQAEKIDEIMRTTRDNLEQLRDKPGGDQHQIHEEMRKLMEEQDQKIEALLDDDQKNQYQQLKKEYRERMRREGPPGGGRPW